MLKPDANIDRFPAVVSCGVDFWLWYVVHSLLADPCSNAEHALTCSKLPYVWPGVHLSMCIDAVGWDTF